MTDEEAGEWFGFRRRIGLYDGMGQLLAYSDSDEMGRSPGHPPEGYLKGYGWDSRDRIVRLLADRDDERVQRFQAKPWARMVTGDHENRFWVAADGHMEISELCREPGDAICQEAWKYLWFSEGDPEELFRRMAEKRRVLLRLHVARLYGEMLPKDEWEEPQPRYW
ncbi:hypothetical protein [Streptomyces sp. Isolate_45]|uniref:hypothetical protein n=1 Tax=Streptomyces sp. Isolate_45 TaxID=2950111 RepID=UPI0024820E50|nr:hypothetical protein [Streptomyces sp. Isolate_45]MDA5284127.1 hypothetical protein [Streptomyces sp. Isolate_45]